MVGRTRLPEDWKRRAKLATVRLPDLGGRGVLVPGPFVLTAAHCVKWSGTGGMALGDHFVLRVEAGRHTFRLGVVAVEPVADIAVLGPPDSQVFCDDAEAFEDHSAATPAVRVCAKDFAPRTPTRAHLLNLNGMWIECVAREGRVTPGRATPPIAWLTGGRHKIEGGMSGGPVLNDGGELVGLVSFSSEEWDHDGAMPRPHRALPLWVWQHMEAEQRRTQKRAP